MRPSERSRVGVTRQTPIGLEQRVLRRAREAGFGRQDQIVVGFSGGRDSLALAGALRWVKRSLGIDVVLIHVDHQLRSSSEEESKRAAALANALDMDFRGFVVAESLAVAHPGVGLEESARRERYRILFEAAVHHGAAAVATAHHREDQAETVLLHLLRGGGVHGAAGMAERALAPVPLHDISQKSSEIELGSEPWLWRPLLGEAREAIDEYVRGLGLEPIEDSSNEDTTLRRNALRHDVLPLLERHVPGATIALARYAGLAAEDDRLLEEITVSAMAEIVDPGGRITAAALFTQPLAIQRRLVRRWLGTITGSTALTAERTDAVLTLAQAGEGGRAVEIGEGWSVCLERGMLRVDKSGSQQKEGQ